MTTEAPPQPSPPAEVFNLDHLFERTKTLPAAEAYQTGLGLMFALLVVNIAMQLGFRRNAKAAANAATGPSSLPNARALRS